MKLPRPDHSDFEVCPAGNHLAICCRLVDLGTQKVNFKGTEKHQRKVFIEWELPHEITSDEVSFVVGRRYTLSSDERSTLRQHLEAWRGRRFDDRDFGDGGFDLSSILGKACFLSVVHTDRDGRTYADVEGVASLPKGTTVPPAVAKPVYFSLDPDAYDADLFQKLSAKLQATIRTSPEFRRLSASTETVSAVGGDGSEVAF